MAISAATQLATKNTNTSGQTSWVTASITFPAGSLAVCLIDVAGGTANATGVQDSAANAWTDIAATHSSRAGFYWVSQFYRYYASGATVTVTTSFASSNMVFGWIGYVTGTDTVPSDASGNNNTRATSLAVSTSGTLAVADELATVMFGSDASPSAWPTTNYTTLLNASDGVRNAAMASAYRLFSGGSGSTETVTANYAVTNDLSSGIATFKPSAGGGGVVVKQLSALGVG